MALNLLVDLFGLFLVILLHLLMDAVRFQIRLANALSGFLLNLGELNKV